MCIHFYGLSLSSFSSQCIRRYLDRVWSPASIDYLDDPPVVIKEHTSSPPPPPPAQFNTSDKSIEIKLNKQGGTSLGFSIAGGKGTVHIVTYTHTQSHTRVVIGNFDSYLCIYCMYIIPDLKEERVGGH